MRHAVAGPDGGDGLEDAQRERRPGAAEDVRREREADGHDHEPERGHLGRGAGVRALTPAGEMSAGAGLHDAVKPTLVEGEVRPGEALHVIRITRIDGDLVPGRRHAAGAPFR